MAAAVAVLATHTALQGRLHARGIQLGPDRLCQACVRGDELQRLGDA